MDLKIMEIDPNTAKMMLLSNNMNRRLSQRHVNKLAAEMASGHYMLNGQTIAFSANGKLLDGQHRLNAVIQSGVTVKMAVAYGVEGDRVFQTYDQTALKRGIHQIAEMQGLENAVNITAIARRLVLWERTPDKAQFSFLSTAWRDQADYEVIEYVDTHHEEIQQMFDELRTALPYKKCKARSSLIAALILCNRANRFYARLFIGGLKLGTELTEGSALRLLREKLMDPPKSSGLWWETEVMALTIKAWNKCLAGKTSKFLRWRQEGDYPERFPVPSELQ